MSFLANSDVKNLIEGYFLCFRTVLTIKFKMAPPNGCQNLIEKQKNKVIYFKQDGSKM